MGGVVGLIFRGCGRGESNRAEFLEIRGGWEDRRGGFDFFCFSFFFFFFFFFRRFLEFGIRSFEWINGDGNSMEDGE